MNRHEDENGWRWYQEDGKPDLISVTTVLDVAVPQSLKRWMTNTSAAKQEKVKKKTANIGTAIHTAVELDLKGEKPDLTEETEPAFKRWLEMKEKHRISAVDTEIMVKSYKYGYAGTVDILGWFDGKLCIMDVKTGYYSIKAGWQMGMYRLAHLEQDTMKNDVGLVGLSIHRDGSVGKPLVYEHIDFVTRKGLNTLEVFKGLYFGKLNKVEWPYLKKDSVEEYLNA